MVSIIMICCGLAIAGIWTADILKGEKIDISNGLFKARDSECNSLMWPHWIAEYSTGIGLIIGGVGIFLNISWSYNLSLIVLGALLYTSMNSLSWAFANKERLSYAIPMLISFVGACFSILLILTA